MFWNLIVVVVVQHCECIKCHCTIHFLIFIYFLATPRGMWNLSSPHQESNMSPMQHKLRVLTTGLPGKSLLQGDFKNG